MTFLSGPISDRLRAMFTTDQILNNPRKPESLPMPKKGVKGKQVSKPGRKKK